MSDLKLNSLIIKNFRCLEDFEVKKLGRVNLIVGKNNSGKSSVLEALRIYAANGQRRILEEIAAERNEVFMPIKPNLNKAGDKLPFESFFSGRQFPKQDGEKICIGDPNIFESQLLIENIRIVDVKEIVTNGGIAHGQITYKSLPKNDIEIGTKSLNVDSKIEALHITKGQEYGTWYLEDRATNLKGWNAKTIPFGFISTDLISTDELADLWDDFALSDEEQLVIKAAQIITPELTDIHFKRNENFNSNGIHEVDRLKRIAMVKLSNSKEPVPLKSLGEGIQRILQIILKILSAKDGFLLIDEFENGLYYSVQEKVWNLIFELAEKYNVQVFATTHSWDCIQSFAKVAAENNEIDGLLFRLGRSARNSDKGRVIASPFDKNALFNLTQSDIEVR